MAVFFASLAFCYCYKFVNSGKIWIFAFKLAIIHIPLMGFTLFINIPDIRLFIACGSIIATGFGMALPFKRRELSDEDNEEISKLLSRLFPTLF